MALKAAPQAKQAKRGDGDVGKFLARLWAQVDSLLADLESAKLPPKEHAATIAALARIAPQLVEADRKASLPLDGRDPSELTNAQLKALIDANAGRD